RWKVADQFRQREKAALTRPSGTLSHPMEYLFSALFCYGARVGWSRTLSATSWMKERPVCRQVAAMEASTCQAWAPFGVLLPQEILRAMTARRNWRSARLLVAGSSARSKKVNK